ncbi:MAG: hypothetical protein AB7G48_07545 [Nitrospiraceae bacterium]
MARLRKAYAGRRYNAFKLFQPHYQEVSLEALLEERPADESEGKKWTCPSKCDRVVETGVSVVYVGTLAEI